MIMTFCNMTPVVFKVITSVLEKPAQAFSFSELRLPCRHTAHCCMLRMVNEDTPMPPCSDEVERSNIFTDIAKYSLRTDYLQRTHLTLHQHRAIMFKISQSTQKEGLQCSWTAWPRISSCYDPENTGNYSHNNVAIHPRRLESSPILQREPQIK